MYLIPAYSILVCFCQKQSSRIIGRFQKAIYW